MSGEKGIGCRAPSSALLVHSGEVIGGVSNFAVATRPGPKSCHTPLIDLAGPGLAGILDF